MDEVRLYMACLIDLLRLTQTSTVPELHGWGRPAVTVRRPRRSVCAKAARCLTLDFANSLPQLADNSALPAWCA